MHSYARHLCKNYTTFSVLQTAFQKIVPEGEWDAFLASLRTPLPTSFRISGSGKFAATLRDHLENDFFSQFASGPLVVRDFFPLVKALLFEGVCKPGTKKRNCFAGGRRGAGAATGARVVPEPAGMVRPS